jgi:hypothetical protein
MPSHVQPNPKQQRLLPDVQAKPLQLLKKAFLDG